MTLHCLNGGQLIFNLTSNESYCQCDSCHKGVQCDEIDICSDQTEFNVDRDRLIVYSIYLCLSLVNNLLSIAVFYGSKRIRCTNVGIYLIMYSITSILGSVVLVIGQSVQYLKPYPFSNNVELSGTFYCLLDKSGCQVTVLICLWLSALVAFERSLIICCNFKINATRKRLLITLLPSFWFITITSVSFLFDRCIPRMPYGNLIARLIPGWFYGMNIIAGLIYIIATIIILVSFASRIYDYGNSKKSKTKIFFILLKKHIFIIIPTLIYGFSAIPYQIWFKYRIPSQPYFECGISSMEYYYKIIQQTLPNIPVTLTWCLFVYPSNVYMTEYYAETWIGKRLMRRYNTNHQGKSENQRLQMVEPLSNNKE